MIAQGLGVSGGLAAESPSWHPASRACGHEALTCAGWMVHGPIKFATTISRQPTAHA